LEHVKLDQSRRLVEFAFFAVSNSQFGRLRRRTTDWKSVADRENALKPVSAPLQQASACFL
jgi:hypothetical protein